MNKNIAVYGSLRKMFGNHRILRDGKATLISEERVSIPYKMISLGGFPGLIPSKEHSEVTIEIYEVNPQTYERVEWLEGFPSFYQKAIINSTVGETEVYVLENERYREYPIVECGDWVEYNKIEVE